MALGERFHSHFKFALRGQSRDKYFDTRLDKGGEHNSEMVRVEKLIHLDLFKQLITSNDNG